MDEYEFEDAELLERVRDGKLTAVVRRAGGELPRPGGGLIATNGNSERLLLRVTGNVRTNFSESLAAIDALYGKHRAETLDDLRIGLGDIADDDGVDVTHFEYVTDIEKIHQ